MKAKQKFSKTQINAFLDRMLAQYGAKFNAAYDAAEKVQKQWALDHNKKRVSQLRAFMRDGALKLTDLQHMTDVLESLTDEHRSRGDAESRIRLCMKKLGFVTESTHKPAILKHGHVPTCQSDWSYERSSAHPVRKLVEETRYKMIMADSIDEMAAIEKEIAAAFAKLVK